MDEMNKKYEGLPEIPDGAGPADADSAEPEETAEGSGSLPDPGIDELLTDAEDLPPVPGEASDESGSGLFADRLVGVLGIAVRISQRTVPDPLRPEGLPDIGPRGGVSLVGNAGGIGSEVGDESHRSLFLQIHPLVELLGDPHGLGRGKAQLFGGLLLQSRGGKG